MPVFIDKLKHEYHLSDTAIELLISKMEVTEIPKKRIFLEEGSANHTLYIVNKGLLKAWFYGGDKERILYFAFEGEMATIPSYSSPRSMITLETIEDTELYAISFQAFDKLLKTSAELSYFAYRMMVDHAHLIDHDYVQLLWREKTEQYKRILNDHPDVFQRIPLKDIASYLNVTPSSLSRIRANIYK